MAISQFLKCSLLGISILTMSCLSSCNKSNGTDESWKTEEWKKDHPSEIIVDVLSSKPYWLYVDGILFYSHTDNETASYRMYLPPGNYSVDALFLGGSSSFPFVVSKIYPVTLSENAEESVRIEPPNNLTSPASVSRSGHSLCTTYLDPPNVVELSDTAIEYAKDPLVIALKGAIGEGTRWDNTTLLALSDDIGGPREFDKTQITDIVDRLEKYYLVDYSEDLERCESSHPQFAELYHRIATVNGKWKDQIESFRSLAN